MANEEHVDRLRSGVGAWNAWREEKPDIRVDLSEAHLRGEDLIRADLRGANLIRADLSNAKLRGANLRGATVVGADLMGADLSWADLSSTNFRTAELSGADLSGADLRRAYLVDANLVGANLIWADLRRAKLAGVNFKTADLRRANLNAANLMSATLVNADLTGADLTGCRIFGVSAWGLNLSEAKQQNLIITGPDEPEITVDNIEVAQFVYLLLHNEKIRDVIDTIGKKGVLLLGRFTEGRIVILERLKEKLRELDYVPMVFNFDKPETKDFTETVRLLANLSHFVIVDITNPRSTPLELQATVPDYMVPFVPILQQGEQPFAMFVDLQNKYDWMLQPTIAYPSVDPLLEVLDDKIVRRAEEKFNELLARRANKLRVENV
jgi:Pentapeptide repeats (8 copies)